MILPTVIASNILSYIPTDVVQMMELDIMKNTVILLPLSALLLLAWLVARIRNSGQKP